MMNKRLMQSYIIRYDGKQSILAHAMGISLSSLNAKINGKTAEFTQGEMDFIRKRYNLGQQEVSDIFFAG